MSDMNIIDALKAVSERQKQFGGEQYAPKNIPVVNDPLRTHTELQENARLIVCDDENYSAFENVYIFDAENEASNQFNRSSPYNGFTLENKEDEWTISGASSANYTSLYILDKSGNMRFSVADHGWQAGDTIWFYVFARQAASTNAKIRIECRDESGSTIVKKNNELCSTAAVSFLSYTIDSSVVDISFMVYCAAAGTEINNSFLFGIFRTPNQPVTADKTLEISPSETVLTTLPFASSEVEIVNIIDYINSHRGNETEAVSLTYLTPEMFGAKGDGTGDDTDAVNECIVQANVLKIPVRGYGKYRCSGTVVMSFTEMDILLNVITSGAVDVPAILIDSCNDSIIKINRVIANSTTVAAILVDGSNIRNKWDIGVLSCKYSSAFALAETMTSFGRNSVHMTNVVSGNTAFLNKSDVYYSHYNEFDVTGLTVTGGDCVDGFSETTFRGVFWRCQNGFIACNCNCCRFYHIGLEHEVYGGYKDIRYCMIYYGRTIEFMDRTSSGDNFGSLLKFVGANHGNHIYYHRVALPNIDVSEMYSREELLAYASTEEVLNMPGYRTSIGFPNVIHAQIENCTYYQYSANTNATQPCSNTCILGMECYVTVGRKVVVPHFYNLQNVDVEHIDMRDFTYPFLPSELKINVDSTIILNDSYCSLGVKELIVDQSTNTAVIKDRNENIIFNGSDYGIGIYKIQWLPQMEPLSESGYALFNLLNDLVRVERMNTK